MAISVSELSTQSTRRLTANSLWRVWQLDPARLVLVHTKTGDEVDLERIDRSAEMLDWIFQVSNWANAQDVGDLVTALKEIFSPQANLCSFGTDRRIPDVTQFLRSRIAGPPPTKE